MLEGDPLRNPLAPRRIEAEQAAPREMGLDEVGPVPADELPQDAGGPPEAPPLEMRPEVERLHLDAHLPQVFGDGPVAEEADDPVRDAGAGAQRLAEHRDEVRLRPADAELVDKVEDMEGVHYPIVLAA